MHVLSGKQQAVGVKQSPESGDQPRFAQYITMSPARPDDAKAVAARLEAFRLRRPPQSTAFVGDDRGYEDAMAAPQLTALGRKLLGDEAW